jgi:hypothetical protein
MQFSRWGQSDNLSIAKAGRIVLGPDPDLYASLMRQAIIAMLRERTKGDKDPSLNGEVVNRASIVTAYVNLEYDFKMLFTGDAYDQAADLIDTLWSWREGLTDWDFSRRTGISLTTPQPIVKVDVLKVRPRTRRIGTMGHVFLTLLRCLTTAPIGRRRLASTVEFTPTSISSAPVRTGTTAITPRYPH